MLSVPHLKRIPDGLTDRFENSEGTMDDDARHCIKKARKS